MRAAVRVFLVVGVFVAGAVAAVSAGTVWIIRTAGVAQDGPR